MVLFEVFLFCVLNTFLLTSAKSGDDNNLTSDEIIDMINALNSTWNAGPTDMTDEDLRILAGALVDGDNSTSIERVIHDPDFIAKLPESFDAREHWSNCPSLSHIRNQGRCGSCWAVAITGAITDRYCIKSNGTKQFTFSAQDLTSCDITNLGCQGGATYRGLEFWVKTGIVSGGDYGSNDGCYPYEMEAGDGGVLPTPPCKTSCRADYNKKYLEDKQHGQNVISVASEGDMMAEIYKNGPIVSAFHVFRDFGKYKTGIYRHLEGASVGWHAVRTIGWGVEGGEKYWLVANSWGTDWANEGGYFKILRGKNECEFEQHNFIAQPVV